MIGVKRSTVSYVAARGIIKWRQGNIEIVEVKDCATRPANAMRPWQSHSRKLWESYESSELANLFLACMLRHDPTQKSSQKIGAGNNAFFFSPDQD
jgi:hypothetical protein